MEIKEFWDWLSSNYKTLLRKSHDDIASVVHERFCRVLPDGAVEVTNHNDDIVLIFSACGRKDQFPLVREFVSASPAVPNFRFIALKPARGFDFVLTMN